MWQIEFTSSKFSPFLPDDCQANPGVYGFELAVWLSKQLAARNVITSYPNGEDCRWFLDYNQDDIEFMICCGSMSENDAASSGEPITCTVFIKPLLSVRQKLRHMDPDPIVKFLATNICEVLESEGMIITQSGNL